MSRGSSGNEVAWWGSDKCRIIYLRNGWQCQRKRGPDRFKISLCRKRGDSLRQGVAAALLLASSAGSLHRHLAVHAHLTRAHLSHGHGTVRNAWLARKTSHAARRSSQSRLRGKHNSSKERNDLEKPFHTLQQDYHCLVISAGVSNHT